MTNNKVTYQELRKGKTYEKQSYNGRFHQTELYKINRKRTFGGHVSIQYSLAGMPSGFGSGFAMTAEGRGSTLSDFAEVS